MSCNCPTLPIPGMHVPKLNSMARRFYFLNVLHPVLSNAGQQETIFLSYAKNNFDSFLRNKVADVSGIKYLRTYLVSVSNRLDIIYATNDPHNPGKELYYELSNTTVTKIERPQALPAATRYVKDKLSLIETVFNPYEGNTICITHSKKHIQEFIKEIECQQPSAIRAYFAVYPENDPALSGRIHIEYVLVRINGLTGREEEFYIDDCEEFENREITKEKLLRKNINNGTLCPPCTGCEEEQTPTLEPPPDCEEFHQQRSKKK